MVRYNHHKHPKPAYATPAASSDPKPDPRKVLKNADGSYTIRTKEDMKTQRRIRYANTHIPLPPPLPKRADPLDRPVVHRSRHDFVPNLSFARTDFQDPIIRAVNRQLKAHNNSSFDKFVNPLTISMLERRPWHDFVLGTRTQLCCVIGGVEFTARVALYISKGEPMVVYKDDSIRFQDWLSSLSLDAGPDILGPPGYKKLHDWHQARGAQQQCPRLNDDVMRIVLLHAIGEVRNVRMHSVVGFMTTMKYDNHDRGARGTQVENCRGLPLGPPAIPKLDRRVMCINKQLAQTARRVLEYDTIKSFDEFHTIASMMREAPPNFLESLSRVQLAFNDQDHLNFFRIPLPGLELSFDYINDPPRSSVLKELPNLNYLELWFNSPADSAGYINIDWDPSSWTQSCPGSYKYCRYPCRRAMVDYILCFAYSAIAHIRSVNLTGYVKNETRNHWLSILQDGVNRDNHLEAAEQRIKEILAQPVADL